MFEEGGTNFRLEQRNSIWSERKIRAKAMKHFQQIIINFFMGYLVVSVLAAVAGNIRQEYPYNLKETYVEFDVSMQNADEQEIQEKLKEHVRRFVLENPKAFLAVYNEEFGMEKIYDGRISQSTEELFSYNRWEGHYVVSGMKQSIFPAGMKAVSVQNVEVHKEEDRWRDGIRNLRGNFSFITMVVGLVFAYSVYYSSMKIEVLNKEKKIAVFFLMGAQRGQVAKWAVLENLIQMALAIVAGGLLAVRWSLFLERKYAVLVLGIGCVLTLILNKGIWLKLVAAKLRRFQRGDLKI